jgi:hypothetical protein
MENGGKDSPQLTHVNVMPASEALQTEKMAHFLPDSAAAAAAAVGAAKAKSQVRRRRRCCSVARPSTSTLIFFESVQRIAQAFFCACNTDVWVAIQCRSSCSKRASGLLSMPKAKCGTWSWPNCE